MILAARPIHTRTPSLYRLAASRSNPPGRVRLEIDGKTMTLTLKARLGTKEIEELLGHAAALVRQVRGASDPTAAR